MRRTSVNRNPLVWFVACGWLGTSTLTGGAILADEPTPGLQPSAIQRAVLDRDWPTAEKLAGQLISREPNLSTSYLLRAEILLSQGKFAASLPDWDRAVELKPDDVALLQKRGEVRFQAGQIAASTQDFDRAIKLRPTLEAGHWQRGINYYYQGQWEQGRKQFEQYQNVDDNDVENVVWRAMCMARDPQFGWSKAAADLWKVRHDRRVPLMVVHQLFADKVTPQDVLAAVDAGNPNEQELLSRRFYAHLYLGLYYDCKQQPDQALPHLELAAGKYRLPGYMADVASVHLNLLKKSALSK
jgi:lipoprotein NlpI